MDVNYLSTTVDAFLEGVQKDQIPVGTLIVLSDADGAYYRPPEIGAKIRRIAKERIVDSLENIKLTILDDETLFFAKSGEIGLAVRVGDTCEMKIIADRVESPSTEWKNYRQGTNWVPASECICIATATSDNQANTITFSFCDQDNAAISDPNCTSFFVIANILSGRTATFYNAILGQNINAVIKDGLFVQGNTVAEIRMHVTKNSQTGIWSAECIAGATTLGSIRYAPTNLGAARVLVGYSTVEVPPQFPHILPAVISTNGTSSTLNLQVEWITKDPASLGEMLFRCEPGAIASNLNIKALSIKFGNSTPHTVKLNYTISSNQLIDKVSIFGGTFDAMDLLGASTASASEVSNIKKSIAEPLETGKLYGLMQQNGELKEVDLGYVPNYHIVEVYTEGTVNAGKLKVNLIGTSLPSGRGQGTILYHIIVGSALYLSPAEVTQLEVYSNGVRHSTIQLNSSISPDQIRESEIYIEGQNISGTGVVYTVDRSSSVAGLSSAVLRVFGVDNGTNLTLCVDHKPISLEENQAYHLHYIADQPGITGSFPTGSIKIDNCSCKDASTGDQLTGRDLVIGNTYTIWRDRTGWINFAALQTLTPGVLRVHVKDLNSTRVSEDISKYDRVEVYGVICDSADRILLPSISVPENKNLTIDFSEVCFEAGHPEIINTKTDGVSISLNIEEGSCVRIIGFDTYMSGYNLPIVAQGLGGLILDKCVQATTHNSPITPLIQCNCDRLIITNSKIQGIVPDENSVAAAVTLSSTSQGVIFTGCDLGVQGARNTVISSKVSYAAGNTIQRNTQMYPASVVQEFSVGNLIV